MNYYQKYLKYKQKYLRLSGGIRQYGGACNNDLFTYQSGYNTYIIGKFNINNLPIYVQSHSLRHADYIGECPTDEEQIKQYIIRVEQIINENYENIYSNLSSARVSNNLISILHLKLNGEDDKIAMLFNIYTDTDNKPVYIFFSFKQADGNDKVEKRQGIYKQIVKVHNDTYIKLLSSYPKLINNQTMVTNLRMVDAFFNQQNEQKALGSSTSGVPSLGILGLSSGEQARAKALEISNRIKQKEQKEQKALNVPASGDPSLGIPDSSSGNIEQSRAVYFARLRGQAQPQSQAQPQPQSSRYHPYQKHRANQKPRPKK